ncbi:MAG TPA: hypothetical protein VN948_18000 [Terriglobales bacterium]|nr:hypothetical protein [Terriglobales bacterium]
MAGLDAAAHIQHRREEGLTPIGPSKTLRAETPGSGDKRRWEPFRRRLRRLADFLWSD